LRGPHAPEPLAVEDPRAVVSLPAEPGPAEAGRPLAQLPALPRSRGRQQLAELPAGGNGPSPGGRRPAGQRVRRARRGPALQRRAAAALPVLSGRARPPALWRRGVRLRDLRGIVPLFGKLRADPRRGPPLREARRGGDPDGFALVQP